ncbi:hypothetical protein ACS0TY_004496 [Phlomoides rotata]
MAYKNNNISPPLLIALLLLFATTNPPAHAQIPGGLIISGKLCCTGTGTCPGPPVSGALVSLNCSSPLLGASVDVLGQNITDINGFFNITIPNVLNAVSLLPCNVVVRLPLDQTVCAVLSTANEFGLGQPMILGQHDTLPPRTVNKDFLGQPSQRPRQTTTSGYDPRTTTKLHPPQLKGEEPGC